MNEVDKARVEAYKRDWDPRQYDGNDTYNAFMRDLALVKVSQSDEDIIEELDYIEAHG